MESTSDQTLWKKRLDKTKHTLFKMKQREKRLKSEKKNRAPVSCRTNSVAEYICNWETPKEHGFRKIFKEITITSDMQLTPPLWQKAKKN